MAGDTDFCDYPPEASQKPHVGGPVNPNLEEIVALMPDLVLATKSINRRETVNALDRIGLPVYVTDPHSVDEMIASVEHLGNALARKNRPRHWRKICAAALPISTVASPAPCRAASFSWCGPIR